jgi:hypothetical protein
MIKLASFLGCEDGSTHKSINIIQYINRIKDPINAGKNLRQNATSFHDRSREETRNRRKYLKIIKGRIGTVAYTSNSSYLGGKDEEDCCMRLAQAKC